MVASCQDSIAEYTSRRIYRSQRIPDTKSRSAKALDTGPLAGWRCSRALALVWLYTQPFQSSYAKTPVRGLNGCEPQLCYDDSLLPLKLRDLA
jgi:hypothetical protein